VWFPLGFTVLYLILVFVVFSSEKSHDPKGYLPFETLAATGLASVSTLLVWVFYCVSFLLKLRHWAVILFLTGLFSPVVVTATFVLMNSLSSFFSQTH